MASFAKFAEIFPCRPFLGAAEQKLCVTLATQSLQTSVKSRNLLMVKVLTIANRSLFFEHSEICSEEN
jgi:hypothetical protein